MKNQTGIWIDGKKAIIVHLLEDTDVLDVLYADVVYRLRNAGEGKVYTRMGNQYLSHEQKQAARIHREKMIFLDAVIEKLHPEHDLAIFGPAQTKYALKNLLQQHPAFLGKGIPLQPMDDVSDAQFAAYVHRYYAREAV